MLRRKRVSFTVLLTALLILALALPVTAAGTYYVRPGDTLFLIAQRFGTTVQALQEANGIYSDIIYPGEALSIPTGTSQVHTVQRGKPLADCQGLRHHCLSPAGGQRPLGHGNLCRGTAGYPRGDKPPDNGSYN